jgi:murein L,D-transpeptidase YafK
MKKFLLPLALFALLIGCISIFEWKNQRVYAPKATFSEINLADRVDSMGLLAADIHISISKSDYVLRLMADTFVLKSYPVVLGGNPVDDKLRQGDECTPEGIFHLRAKYPHNKWSKFLWIDYPTDDSWRKHRAAKADGTIPESASIGGEVGIHGVPAGKDYLISEGFNWTLGCISLRNEDVDEIYPFVEVGTEVRIGR